MIDSPFAAALPDQCGMNSDRTGASFRGDAEVAYHRGVRIGFALLLLLAPALATANTVLIEAGRDATLIEEPNGALANGSGPLFFVGRTNRAQNSVRRGLVYFDVAAALPQDARVESARLTLYMSPSPNSASGRIGLHRLLADWGEGASSASGGGGDFSAPTGYPTPNPTRPPPPSSRWSGR